MRALGSPLDGALDPGTTVRWPASPGWARAPPESQRWIWQVHELPWGNTGCVGRSALSPTFAAAARPLWLLWVRGQTHTEANGQNRVGPVVTRKAFPWSLPEEMRSRHVISRGVHES
ncbi:uncharacterized protein Tco025E_10136 [Trypanosoma conorhini]|uniref:Uncharacterized protein n=1 Tax=Trypanosoma conorhini TaxID=83891 RepID=A0A422MPQ3_9TRYP|nr:uncharacterized protein Tco025E_10136 [Trypanosoma conorhini]RNE95177.1 hypothetical protein Tco025E_10136 [Trypanosoma conorhini]